VKESFRSLWQCALGPTEGFRRRAAANPTLGAAVQGLLLARTLPAFLAMLLSYSGFAYAYGRITRMEGPVFDYLWANLPPTVNPQDIRTVLHNLPAPPSLGHVAVWLALLAPLGVLSLWLHDAAWDHFGLWMLRGLKEKRSLRLSLVADAEALKVGTLGAVAGLLGDIPVLGCFLGVLLLPVSLYFWVLRGFALAAWHGCPPWKGVVATLLHALLVGILTFGTLGLFVVTILQELRPG
jgi:hypothetical protein